MAKIQYTTPEGTTGEVELTAERMTLGRAGDNQIVIAHDSVSSHHGEVAIDGNAWVLTDLGSTNGTKIGGERVDRLELGHGSTFTLGYVECVFVGDYQEADPAEAAPVYEEAPAYEAAAEEVYSAPSSRTLSSGGYDTITIDRSRRTGFGAKAKPKSNGYAPLIGLGIVGLLACAYAAFHFQQMTL